MILPQIAAILACLILAGLAFLQVLLAAGLPLGRFAWGGQQDVLPIGLRIGSLIAIGIYGVFAVILLGRAGLIGIAEDIATTGSWAVAVYAVVGTGVNAISRSPPERLIMTPLAALLAICCFVVAWG